MSEYDSGELPVDQSYTLEDYTFSITITRLSDEHITAVSASMVHEGQRSVQGLNFEENAQIESWRVQATNNRATVTAKVVGKQAPKQVTLEQVSSMNVSFYSAGKYWPNILVWADFPATVYFDERALNAQTASPISLSYYADKDIYHGGIDLEGRSITPDYGPVTEDPNFLDLLPQGHASDERSIVIAEFEIDISPEPEPGPGPDPGDNWEEPDNTGDPDYTLKVRIVGALSGRHNDPLQDTIFSFSPADQISVKGYGGGGDGGHGGGGGAGASTIIVRRFVTDKAGSIEVTAISKRHGYGSGGGKGGRGGDGCILVFY